MCGMSDCVETLAFKVWRDHIKNMIHTANFPYNVECFYICRGICEKVAYFEDEYPKLKEITSILELELWKSRMNASQLQKNIKTDESSMRRQRRIICGADVRR